MTRGVEGCHGWEVGRLVFFLIFPLSLVNWKYFDVDLRIVTSPLHLRCTPPLLLLVTTNSKNLTSKLCKHEGSLGAKKMNKIDTVYKGWPNLTECPSDM
jgi:hypothetical protein